MELVVAQEGLMAVRTSVNTEKRCEYYKCRTIGCTKTYKFVVNFVPLPAEFEGDGQYSLYHIETEEHMHEMDGQQMRGLSRAQKEIILFCENRRFGLPKRILIEFRLRAKEAIENNLAVVETPTTSSISSFLAYERRLRRGGVAVGGTTLQHIQQWHVVNKHGKLKEIIYECMFS